MNPDQQYEAIFQHLLMTHGPHSSLDVRSLTAQLSELSPISLGWPKFLLAFSHGVMTLTEMKQTDPLTGQTLRGPKPSPVNVPHQALTGDQTVDGPIHLAAVDRDWPLGGPELNHKPPDPILKSILLGHVQESANTAISKIYADSLERPDWPWTTIYDKIKIVADNLNDGLGSNGKGHQTPSSSRNSSAITSPSDTSTASLIRQIKELQNAQEVVCPSKKCHFPGCTVVAFTTAEARKQHYVETHARPKGPSGGRGNHDGRGGRGDDRSGRGGRSSGRGSSNEHNGETSQVNRTVTFNDETSRVYSTVTANDFDEYMRYESDDDYQAQEGNAQEGTYVVRRTEEYIYPDSDEDSVDPHINPPVPIDPLPTELEQTLSFATPPVTSFTAIKREAHNQAPLEAGYDDDWWYYPEYDPIFQLIPKGFRPLTETEKAIRAGYNYDSEKSDHSKDPSIDLRDEYPDHFEEAEQEEYRRYRLRGGFKTIPPI